MTEIQRLLTETIDDLNKREKRDNKPRFSISFIRKHPGLFIGMYVAWFATLAVMLQSETLVGSVWLLVVLFILDWKKAWMNVSLGTFRPSFSSRALVNCHAMIGS